MTEHEIIRPVFGVLPGPGGAVLPLPAYRLTAYAADRIEFKALRCCRIPAQAFSAPRKKAARGRLFCCIRVRFC